MPPVAGVFGKAPWAGDFVSHNLPYPFTTRWHAWILEGISASRGKLGEGWTACFLTAPIWRFHVGDFHGAGAWLGVLSPSVDAHERCFPLLIAVPCAGRRSASCIAEAEPWLRAAEGLMLETLEADWEPGILYRRVAQLGAPAWPERPVEQPARSPGAPFDAVEAAVTAAPERAVFLTVGSEERPALGLVAEADLPPSLFHTLVLGGRETQVCAG